MSFQLLSLRLIRQYFKRRIGSRHFGLKTHLPNFQPTPPHPPPTVISQVFNSLCYLWVFLGLWRSVAHTIFSTPAVCGGLAHACASAAARANSILDAPTSQLSTRSCMNIQPISSRAAAKSRCPSGERACTRAKGKRDTTHVFVLSSARTLR